MALFIKHEQIFLRNFAIHESWTKIQITQSVKQTTQTHTHTHTHTHKQKKMH